MASAEVSVLYQLAESVRVEYVLAHATDWEESTAAAEESPTFSAPLEAPEGE